MIFSDLFFQLNNVTEAAAISCSQWIGKGNKIAADQAAVNGMKECLGNLPIDGEIVIGEGERDQAPMLYIGEKIGRGALAVDIAVDPLEGTNLCANGSANAISAMAVGPKNSLLKAPDVYMRKIAVGVKSKEKIININASVTENIQSLSNYKNCAPTELKAIVLKRERHNDIIHELHSLGVRVELIDDGDILGVISTTSNAADIYLGIGGAPEGVIAAAALKCLGGQMQCQLLFENDAQIQRANKMGVKDPQAIYQIDDMVKEDVIFCATGVTDGFLLKGVQQHSQIISAQSFVSSYKLKKTLKISSQLNCD